jgi:hypothetical protein
MRFRRRVFLFRFFSRLSMAAVALLLTVLMVRVAWGWIAEKRLANLHRRFQAQGAQLDFARFDLPLVAGERTANATVLAAARSFDPMGFRGLLTFSPYSAPGAWETSSSEQEKLQTRRILHANDHAMALLDDAQTLPQGVWTGPLQVDTGDGITLEERLRLLSEFLLNAAYIEHQDLNDREVMRLLSRILVIDRAVVATPSLSAHTFAMSTRARIAALTDGLYATLQVDVPADPHPGGATPAQVKKFIAQLADDRAFHNQLEVLCEFQIYQVEHFGSPLADAGSEFIRDGQGELGSWWFKPLVADERRRELNQDLFWLPIVRATSYETFRLLPDPTRAFRSNLGLVVLAASQRSNYLWLRTIPQHFRALTDDRAAAVLLAARLAEVLDGTPPLTAEILVPGVLPDAPIDPFAADERPLRYRLDPLGPTVWSVGSNGVDEGGAMAITLRGGRSSVDHPDIVYGGAWRAMRLGLYSGAPPGPLGVVTTLPAATSQKSALP